eukprot:17696-Heterococcus_DN1.PRE.2
MSASESTYFSLEHLTWQGSIRVHALQEVNGFLLPLQSRATQIIHFLMSARVSYALATTVIALITVIFCIVRKNGAAPLVTLQPYHRAWQQLIKYDLRYNRQGFDDKMAQHRQAQ